MKHTLAIIGFGGMGSWHYKNITEKVPNICVKGAYDVRSEAMENVKNANLHCYANVDEILADNEIDIITIATPNDVHKDLIIKCLQAGKNVVCEKPVTMNAIELEQVIEVANKTDRLFSIHHNRRWDKDYCIVKEILAKNTIGKPYFIESRVQGSRGAMHGWRGYKQNGGGMLLDWGVHLIDQMLMMIDSPVVSVDSHLISVFTPEVEDSIKLTLRFENELCAVLEMSTNCFVNHPRWHVCCEKGTAVIENWACDGKIVCKKVGSEMAWADDIVYTEAGPTRTMAPRPVETTEQIALPEVNTNWADYYTNIAEVLDGNTELIVTPAQALRTMKVIDLCFKSAEEKCGIKCYL